MYISSHNYLKNHSENIKKPRTVIKFLNFAFVFCFKNYLKQEQLFDIEVFVSLSENYN